MTACQRATRSLVLVVLGACTLPSTRQARIAPFTAGRAVLPAHTVTRVIVDAAVGTVTIDSTSGDSLIVVAELTSGDTTRLRTVCAQSTQLATTNASDGVHFALEQRSRNRCGERWRLLVPASVAVHVTGRVLDVTVDARLPALRVRMGGPGSVRGRVDAPDVDIDIGHGGITLRSTRSDLRRASAISKIGRAQLEVNGLRIPSVSKPPGAVAEVTGRGESTLLARTGNGSVSVTVEGRP